MNKQPIRLLVVDDHAMIRKGLQALLKEVEDVFVVGEASNGLNAIEQVKRLQPDVVLLDLLMPGIDGVETVRRIVAEHPQQGIILLTAYTGDDKLLQAVQAGARGYLLKEVSSEELVEAIRSVAQGHPWLSSAVAFKLLRSKLTPEKPAHPGDGALTDREMEVLRLLCMGKTDQEISRELFLTDVTVRSHVSRILIKLGLKNRVEAALYGIRTGVVSLYETEPVGP